ncbi:hypothetical protein STEG23_037496, partial [Scotinomys teguina]
MATWPSDVTSESASSKINLLLDGCFLKLSDRTALWVITGTFCDGHSVTVVCSLKKASSGRYFPLFNADSGGRQFDHTAAMTGLLGSSNGIFVLQDKALVISVSSVSHTVCQAMMNIVVLTAQAFTVSSKTCQDGQIQDTLFCALMTRNKVSS